MTQRLAAATFRRRSLVHITFWFVLFFDLFRIHHAWNDDGWHGNVGGSTDKWYSRWYHGYKLDSGYGWW